MIQKTLKIGEKEVTFRSSASIPRLYRIKFRRDVFKDIDKLKEAYNSKKDLEIEDLEIFENIAYVMALHANPTMKEDIDTWLDGFEMFSIYEILPQIIDMF